MAAYLSQSEKCQSSHYIFVANDIPIGPGRVVSANEILQTLKQSGFWAFSEYAPLHAKLLEGDQVLIYLAGPRRRFFMGRCIVASPSTDATDRQAATLSALGLGFLKRIVRFQNYSQFKSPVPIVPLVPDLSFIKEKQNYGLHLRLPIVRLSKEDFALILKSAGEKGA